MLNLIFEAVTQIVCGYAVRTEEAVRPSPPALVTGRATSAPVPHNRHAIGAGAGAAPHSDTIAPAGAAVIGSPPSTDSIHPSPTLRQPSVRLYVTDATVVNPSAPAAAPPAPVTDPLLDALMVVDDLSSMYLRLDAAAAPLSILHTALEAAVAYCDDAIDGPPADLPSSGDVLLDSLLEFLAGISNMYREYGSKYMPVPLVREALVRAMVQCVEKSGESEDKVIEGHGLGHEVRNQGYPIS